MQLIKRFGAAAAILIAAPVVFCADSPAPAGEITYTKHVAKIIQERCQECHRPGQIAPFSLTNYRQVKGWAKMIKEVVHDNRMPPWHADPNVGKFANDRSLSKAEKDLLFSWIDNGAPQGDPADLPEAPVWDANWRIGTPDVVFSMPEDVTIPATGVIDYKHFTTPTNFTEDKWVKSMEARAGNPKVVHHILMFTVAPGAERERNQFQGIGSGFLTGFAPGTVAIMLEPGQAIKIPAGANLMWQMHYTPTGREETDRSEFALVFADGPPTEEVFTGTAQNFRFKIPAGADNHEVVAESVVPFDIQFRGMTPHMHYRGKSFTYTATFPDGREQLLLSVPKYDFNWQIGYELAEYVNMPAGTKLRCVAHFDNSANNPANPDPSKDVIWGDQTWEEMMIGWFNYTRPLAEAEKATQTD